MSKINVRSTEMHDIELRSLPGIIIKVIEQSSEPKSKGTVQVKNTSYIKFRSLKGLKIRLIEGLKISTRRSKDFTIVQLHSSNSC